MTNQAAENDAKKVKTKPNSDFDFSLSLDELEQIAEYLQGNEVNLDLAIKKYERGVELASQLKAYLKEAENKVNTIKQSFDK